MSPKIKPIYILISEQILCQKVTCDVIRATGLSAGLALDETDIELMGLEELELCLDTLGSLELDNKVQRKIWSLVNKVSMCFIRCASCICLFTHSL
jgi:hypothetical protein